MNFSKRAMAVKESSTLAISAKEKEMKAQGVDVVGFGVGEPDFQTPKHICDAGITAILNGCTKYTPSSGTLPLRKAICNKLLQENHLHYEPSQIVVSNGAKHALQNVFTALLEEGDEVILPAPFWLSYAEMIHLVGGVTKIVYTNESTHFKITKEQLQEALTPKTKMILLNSPSNPTGMVYSKEELQMIADFAVSNDLFVCSDEIYEKLVYDEHVEHISIASLNNAIYEKTVVVNGFSKSYAMTGWRVGYSACSKALAKVIGNIQSHQTSNPNSIAQEAALAALEGDQHCVDNMVLAFKARRDYMYDRLSAMPLVSIVKPQGAFYAFVDVSKCCGKLYEDATDFATSLLEKAGVAVVPCVDFGCKNHIRLSYATSQENIQKGMDRLEAFVKEVGKHIKQKND